MLEVSHLDVFYGKSPALRDVSVKVEEKEIVALVGANVRPDTCSFWQCRVSWSENRQITPS